MVFTILLIGQACNNLSYRWNVKQAVSSMRRIREAENIFKAGKSIGRYGTLEELANAGLIDAALASGTHNGYRFNVTIAENSYKATAVPIEYSGNAYSGTGYLSLYMDESGMIRGGDKGGAAATAQDEPFELQQNKVIRNRN